MSIILPPQDHLARELIDVKHLAEVFAPENIWKINTFNDAVKKARERINYSIDSTLGNIISVNVICEIVNNEYILLNVSLDSFSVLWNFTTGEGI